MKVITVTAQKGGAGKTTLARNLAIAAAQDGQRVLLIDLDPQKSLRRWWEAREGDAPAMLDSDPPPGRLRATVDAARERFDLLLIDTPPATPAWLGDVLAVADLALAPVRPSPDDLRAIGGTLGALRAARTPFAFILTQAPRAKITDETARVLAGHGRVAPVNMAQRVSYAESAATGQGVTEGSDGRASQEVRDLWSYVKGVME